MNGQLCRHLSDKLAKTLEHGDDRSRVTTTAYQTEQVMTFL
jgi:hypothetical protein